MNQEKYPYLVIIFLNLFALFAVFLAWKVNGPSISVLSIGDQNLLFVMVMSSMAVPLLLFDWLAITGRIKPS